MFYIGIMKPKFIFFAIAGVFSIILMGSCNHAEKTDDAALKAFLNNFSLALKPDTNPHALIKEYFKEEDFKILNLVNLLRGGGGIGVQGAPIFKVTVDMDGATITYPSPGIAQAIVHVSFIRDTIETRRSAFTLTINVANSKRIRIIQANGEQFLKDYIAYENLVKSKTLADKDIFSPITLASFNIAGQLKSKYDSVLWFSHINNKTYYYVVKGKWNMDDYLRKDTVRDYQMGLVSPQQKEIIPPMYDLVHNIGGTFPNLIEVEKDHKHGFYDLNGKIVLPVIYDQVFPVKDDEHLAALRKDDDYYWLKNDFTVSDKTDLKIADIVSNLKQPDSYTLKNDTTDNITEFNSHENHSSLRIPPSYLVDLNILPAIKCFKNPLRKNVYFDDASSLYIVKLDQKPADNGNWLTAAFYSIRDYFLGGRSEFYDTKNVIIVDKKRNQVFAHDIQIDYTPDGSDAPVKCSEYEIRNVNDSLFEVKATANVYIELPGVTDPDISEAPVYHYLFIKNNKLKEINCNRIFSFTKFVKMDDSYLHGCYAYKNEQTDYLKPEYLRYMKNEIFADYNYKFKDTLWSQSFLDAAGNYKPVNVLVDDSLTAIDKYNINWINQKLNASKSKKLAAN